MNSDRVASIETASPLRRGALVWYAAFGGVGAWIVHLVFVTAAEHFTHTDHRWSWTLHAATVVCALATAIALRLADRLRVAARGTNPAGADDGGQLLFLAELGLLVGAISLALILLEGAYVFFLPRA